jgi:hypothetical protein
MINQRNPLFGRAWLQGAAAGLLLVLAGCGGATDSVAPSPETPAADAPLPTDSTTGVLPVDSTLLAPSGDSAGTAYLLAGGAAPGIVFGSFNMQSQYLSTVYTGTLRNLDQRYLVSILAEARLKGARVVVKLVGGPDYEIQNADKTFSFAKWKALVDRFKTVNFSSYVADGTILGNYLIDEPYNASKWGGKIIPQATVEAMAKYSKQLWPGMITLVRAHPSWLAQSTITYTYLDGAWAQYEGRPTVTTWIAGEIAAAKRKGLGLVVGLNVLDGGNGTSGIPGWKKGRWAMSATELRTYGTALLNQSYACGFYMWMHNTTYYGRADIKSAMTELSNKARVHAKTSCRQ